MTPSNDRTDPSNWKIFWGRRKPNEKWIASNGMPRKVSDHLYYVIQKWFINDHSLFGCILLLIERTMPYTEMHYYLFTLRKDVSIQITNISRLIWFIRLHTTKKFRSSRYAIDLCRSKSFGWILISLFSSCSTKRFVGSSNDALQQ